MNKQEITKLLNNTIANEKNSTRVKNLLTIKTLVSKYLWLSHDYDVRKHGKNVNVGDVAEMVVLEMLTEKDVFTESNKTKNDSYDAIYKGQEIEIKSVVKSDSHAINNCLDTYVLLLQGNKQGLYLIDKEVIKMLKGIRLNKTLVETFGNRLATLGELLVD